MDIIISKVTRRNGFSFFNKVSFCKFQIYHHLSRRICKFQKGGEVWGRYKKSKGRGISVKVSIVYWVLGMIGLAWAMFGYSQGEKL